MDVSRRDSDLARSRAGTSRAGSLWQLHTLHRCLPDRRIDRALSARFQQVHRLSHYRKAWRDSVEEDLRSGMGRHIFGCDICQDVCPWNRKAPATMLQNFSRAPELVNPALDWLADISAEEFQPDISRVLRCGARNASGLRRNAVIAMGNSGDRNSSAA